jgi:hypothetical protein
MLKSAFFAAIAAAAGLVAVASPGGSAQCSPGYQPVKIQGNWVCRLKTPNQPLKAKTQNTSRSRAYPKHIPVESYSFGDGK